MADQDRSTETAIADRRTARFGALPPRVRPDDLVESVDTRYREDRPATALAIEHERALHTAA